MSRSSRPVRYHSAPAWLNTMLALRAARYGVRATGSRTVNETVVVLIAVFAGGHGRAEGAVRRLVSRCGLNANPNRLRGTPSPSAMRTSRPYELTLRPCSTSDTSICDWPVSDAIHPWERP